MTHLMKQFVPRLIFSGWLSLSLSGCGRGNSGPQRNDVRGRVTYAGQPVPRGLIRFTPDQSKGNTGPGAIADINNGLYVTKSGRGVVAGPHVIEVAGFDGIAQPDGALPDGAPLFKPQTMQRDLESQASVVDIEVSSKKSP